MFENAKSEGASSDHVIRLHLRWLTMHVKHAVPHFPEGGFAVVIRFVREQNPLLEPRNFGAQLEEEAII